MSYTRYATVKSNELKPIVPGAPKPSQPDIGMLKDRVRHRTSYHSRNPNAGTNPRRGYRYRTPEDAAAARREYRRVWMQKQRSRSTNQKE